MNRYAIVAITFAAQMCLGISYAWSMFVGSFIAKYHINHGDAQFGLGVIIGTFALLTPLTGRLQDRFGPRRVATAGALIFGTGLVLGGIWADTYWRLLVTVGVMCGLGLGSAYPCILATCVKWFPNQQGLITGLAVAGYGIGGAVLTWLTNALLTTGAPPWLQNLLGAFGATLGPAGTVAVSSYLMWLGIIMGVIVLAGALSLSVPRESRRDNNAPAAAAVQGVPWNDIRLWGMFLAFLAGTFAGLMASGNMGQMAAWKGVPAAGMAGVVLFNLVNAVGRIAWGGLSDRLGGRRCMIAGLVLQGIAMAAITKVPGRVGASCWPFYALAMCYGFFYANTFSLYPAECARIWGPSRLGAVYGVIFLAFGIAGLLGPATGGMVLDKYKSYDYALYIAAVICWIGAAIVAVTIRPRPAVAVPADLQTVGCHGPQGPSEQPYRSLGAGRAKA